MVSDRAFHRFALIAGSSALACMGILALGTHGVKGITGSISLDNDERTPVKDVVIVRVEAGAKKYHATIKP